MKTTAAFDTIDWTSAGRAERSRLLVEHLSTAPSGGWLKMLVLGIALPLVIALHASSIWHVGHITWSWRGSIDVYGAGARALATSIGGVALLCHARWFWGIVPIAWAYALGTVSALLMVAGGIAVATWSVLAF